MPDVPTILTDVYKENYSACNKFVQKAAESLDLPPGLVPNKMADQIIDDISAGIGGWVKIGQGESKVSAMTAANQGYFVVALLKAKDHIHHHSHGHIAIVLPTAGGHGYPLLVSGSIIADGRSDGNKSVWGVWRAEDAPNVAYYRSPNIVKKLQDAYQK